MKPGLPQGTRDFLPLTVRRRQFILNTIKNIFELYGYSPIETPAMENLETLMGKYGEEGDRLIFKILNNGLGNPKNIDKARAAFEQALAGKNDIHLTERALRYDLTIPFARFVVMHQQDLAFPFRRYQMQPVWRADRPQKGRYREFWQCDADVVGSNSLVNEAELMAIYRESFHQLRIPGIALRLNNRKVLAGLAECCGKPEALTDITVAIDKLDKIGEEGVIKELEARGLASGEINFISGYLKISGNTEKKLEEMKSWLINSKTAQLGLTELADTLRLHQSFTRPEWHSKIIIDFTLARGLHYYTGFIIEVVSSAVTMGSIGGGGRYDDLTGLFGLKGLSGMGISFGIDRIYDVLEELNLFPQSLDAPTSIIFIGLVPAAQEVILGYVNRLRKQNISAELYMDGGKLEKQMKYANKRNIPFVAIVGDSELDKETVTIKNMKTGAQTEIHYAAVADFIQAS